MNCENRNGTLYLSGDLTVNTLNAQTSAACLNALDDSVHRIDLSGANRTDSACLSLILSLKRKQGRLKNGQSLAVSNLPASAAALADLYEIRSWLD